MLVTVIDGSPVVAKSIGVVLDHSPVLHCRNVYVLLTRLRLKILVGANPRLTSMNKSTVHEMFGRKANNQIFRSTWFLAALHWTLLLAVLIVPLVAWGDQWYAAVGAQTNDKGRQALAFFPDEIWIHEGDSITWRSDADEIHTVTFLKPDQVRPQFQDGCPGFSSGAATFDGSTCVSAPPLAKGQTFTVIFPTAGNFKLVCLVHENMTGTVHVLNASQPLPHNQDFYDHQAADQQRNLLSDADGHDDAAYQQQSDHVARART